jgi:hypothetical protein
VNQVWGGRLSRHGDVPSEERLSGEAAPRFSRFSAATTKAVKEGRHENANRQRHKDRFQQSPAPDGFTRGTAFYAVRGDWGMGTTSTGLGRERNGHADF